MKANFKTVQQRTLNDGIFYNGGKDSRYMAVSICDQHGFPIYTEINLSLKIRIVKLYFYKSLVEFLTLPTAGGAGRTRNENE